MMSNYYYDNDFQFPVITVPDNDIVLFDNDLCVYDNDFWQWWLHMTSDNDFISCWQWLLIMMSNYYYDNDFQFSVITVPDNDIFSFDNDLSVYDNDFWQWWLHMSSGNDFISCGERFILITIYLHN